RFSDMASSLGQTLASRRTTTGTRFFSDCGTPLDSTCARPAPLHRAQKRPTEEGCGLFVAGSWVGGSSYRLLAGRASQPHLVNWALTSRLGSSCATVVVQRCRFG